MRSLFPAVVLASLTVFPSLCLGSGFYIPEVGARAMARGGAFTARADDLTAIYINPAGLSKISGTTLLAEDGILFVHNYYRRAGGYPPVETAVKGRNIPFVGVSSGLGLDSLVVAMAAYGPYGVPEINYSSNGPQRYNVIKAKNDQIMYSLGVGWKPWAPLRVGLNLSRVDFVITYSFKYNFLGEDPTYDTYIYTKLVDRNNITGNVGLLYSPVPYLEFGASYFPPVPIKARGRITANIPPSLQSLLGGTAQTSDELEVDLTIPQIIRVGARYLPLTNMDVEVNLVWMDWSRISSYPLDFKNNTLAPTGSPVSISDTELPKKWRDTLSIRLGGEYGFLENGSGRWVARAGYFYDQGAIPDETLDASNLDSDKHAACAGFGWRLGTLSIDVAYSHVFPANRHVTQSIAGLGNLKRADGDYRTSWDNMVFGLSWKFL